MIRDFNKEMDSDFIYHSWIHSVKNPTRAVMDMTRVLIDSCVERKGIKVFCNDDDPNHILGWVAHGPLEESWVLHFIFVKRDLRKNGIATKLINEVAPSWDEPILCTHWSHYMQKIDARDRWNCKYVGSLLPACIYLIMKRSLEAGARHLHEMNNVG
tara:strand:+ start:1329 stop:1799 length:471 start_codon:yes stop_codon:yes gene_type:complete